MTDPLHPRAQPRAHVLNNLELAAEFVAETRALLEDHPDLVAGVGPGVPGKLLDVATAALERVTELVRTEDGR